MNLVIFLADRLREPSTYAGLGALLAAAGVHVDDAVLQAIVQLLVSVAGIVAVLVPERHHPG